MSKKLLKVFLFYKEEEMNIFLPKTVVALLLEVTFLEVLSLTIPFTDSE